MVKCCKIDIWLHADLRRNPFIPGQIRVMESFFEMGFQLPMSPFMVSMLNHFGRALGQCTVNSILAFCILDQINMESGYQLTIGQVNQYYYISRTTQWRYSLTRRPGVRILFLLPNKPDYGSTRFEIGGQIYRGQTPLMALEHSYEPCVYS